MKTLNKIVIKVGTSTLTQGTTKLSREYMHSLAKQIAQLHGEGKKVILVSSGAIAAGREVLQHPKIDRSLPSKQMFSAIGQIHLMQLWIDIFSSFGLQVGQLLLTRDDFSDRKRHLNARDTLSCLLHHGIIPIINENDTVATKEIRVGDNDNLAALVANLIAADLLVLLTDQNGLYTADPRSNPDAKFIPVVKHIDESIFALAKGSSTSLGTGGMFTKIEAAQIAVQCGTPTVIASSSQPNALVDIAAGKHVGTLFLSDITPRESRKRWLLSEKRQGEIHVDAGAAAKIVHEGASLLPSGITKTVRSFDRGAIVHLVDPAGAAIAVGITNYGDREIQRLIGLHSRSIEEALGYSYGGEIIHRNDMTRIKTNQDTKNE